MTDDGSKPWRITTLEFPIWRPQLPPKRVPGGLRLSPVSPSKGLIAFMIYPVNERLETFANSEHPTLPRLHQATNQRSGFNCRGVFVPERADGEMVGIPPPPQVILQHTVYLLSVAYLALLAATKTMGIAMGVFQLYAFAIMPALRRTDDGTFVGALRQIDTAIVNPWWFLSFFGVRKFNIL